MPGEHEVEDHEVGPHALAQLHAGGAVVGDLDVEALGPQAGGHGRRDHGLVLDHADERCRHGAECARAMWEPCAGLVQVWCRILSDAVAADPARDPARRAGGPLRAGRPHARPGRRRRPPVAEHAQRPPQPARASCPSRAEVLVQPPRRGARHPPARRPPRRDRASTCCPRTSRVLCQPPDEGVLRDRGFTDVRPVGDDAGARRRRRRAHGRPPRHRRDRRGARARVAASCLARPASRRSTWPATRSGATRWPPRSPPTSRTWWSSTPAAPASRAATRSR